MSLNAKFSLIGRLVADPRINVNARNVKTAYLTIAVDKGYTDSQTGQWVERADFHDVVAYGDGFVDMIGRVYAKGTLVAIDGEMRTRKVKLENGYEQTVPALRVGNIMKLSFNKNKGANDDQSFDNQGFNEDHFAMQDQYADQFAGQGYGNLPPM